MIPCPCCGKSDPKLDVSQCGCWFRCQEMIFCEAVVLMPFEQCPFPCCCVSNRQSHNICNCWACFKLNGPLEGAPKKFDSFAPQPKDPWAFVKAFGEASGIPVSDRGAPKQQGMPNDKE